MFALDITKGLAGGQSGQRPINAVAWKEIVSPILPFLAKVSARLQEQVQAFDPEISDYAQYALNNQGKQIRPALVGLAGQAIGPLSESLVTVAVIIEMVHLATLVHDDVMDEAEVRRRRPTMAANWGNEISVLLGDCLFAHALRLAAGFPTTEVCRAVATSTQIVCSGEIRQTNQRRHFELSREDYFKVLGMKTGELFALSCELGASLSGANAHERGTMRHFGMALGTAYQIYDDCLDIFGSEAQAGKSLGTDLAHGKLTLPILIILEQGTPQEQARLKQLLTEWHPEKFPLVLDMLEKYETLNQAREAVYFYLSEAQTHLQACGGVAEIQRLAQLKEFLAQQTALLGVISK